MERSKKVPVGSSRHGAVETNPTRNHKIVGLMPGLAQWVKDPALAMSCGVGQKRGLDLALLCLWCRPAAMALIRPLAREPPCAADVALKRQKIEKKKKRRRWFL